MKNESLIKIFAKMICHCSYIEDRKNHLNTFENIFTTPDVLFAILYQFTQIGELAASIPIEIKDLYKEIDFVNIKGMRNFVVHNYEGINYDIIFDTINKDIPELKDKLINILNRDFNLTSKNLENMANEYINTKKFNYELIGIKPE